MYKVRITVMTRAIHEDLIDEYELPNQPPCDMTIGQVLISENARKPEGMCSTAWLSVGPFVMALACGAQDFYNGWLKNGRSAMVSCNDGFRPVSFLLETIE